MKAAIIGTGFLGSQIFNTIKSSYDEVVFTHHQHKKYPTSKKFNFFTDNIKEIFANKKIDTIFLPAKIEFTENHPLLRDAMLRFLNQSKNSRLIYISSDGIFDGKKGTCKSFLYYPSTFTIESLILGQDQDSVGGRFDKKQDWEGILDELLIFRRALSDSEIETIYSNQNDGKNWDGTTRFCQKITPPLSSCKKTKKISLSTYNTRGYSDSYADSASEFEKWITDNATTAKRFGSGFVDQINSANRSNSNPYHSGKDDYYMSIFKGYIYLPESGNYKFGIDGDDAVEVYIDDNLVTHWYGGHGRAGHAVDIKYLYADSGYHKVEFHMQEKTGGDNYYLYWQKPSQSSMEIVPSSNFFHCQPGLFKTSCVISDPVNGATNPKRIPGATIRYALQLDNDTDYILNDSLVKDNVPNYFDVSTIKNIQIQSGNCNCLSVKCDKHMYYCVVGYADFAQKMILMCIKIHLKYMPDG